MTVLTAAAATAAKVATSSAAQSADAGATSPLFFDFTKSWPGQMDLIAWAQKMGPGMSTLLIILGIIYLAFGLSLFKGLIVINAGFVGAWVGVAIGDKSGSAVPCGVLGAFVAVAITFPLMKWAVAVMGGLLGAALGGSMWRMFDLDPRFAWAGAGMGLIAFGMFCFILFRSSVIAYMSLQGSIMLICGLLGLLYKYQDISPKLTENLLGRHFILPMAIFIPAVIGWIYQQSSSPPAEAAAAKK